MSLLSRVSSVWFPLSGGCGHPRGPPSSQHPFPPWALPIAGALFPVGCPKSWGPPYFPFPRSTPSSGVAVPLKVLHFPPPPSWGPPDPGVQQARSQPCPSPPPAPGPLQLPPWGWPLLEGAGPRGVMPYLPQAPLWGAALPGGSLPRCPLLLCPRARCERQAEVPAGACQVAPLAFCSPRTLLARRRCPAWQERGLGAQGRCTGGQRPGGLPAPCRHGVPSPARAKPRAGSPTENPDPLAPTAAVTRSLLPGLGFTVKETGMSCRAAISILLLQIDSRCAGVVGWWPRGLFGLLCLGRKSRRRKRWSAWGPGAAGSRVSPSARRAGAGRLWDRSLKAREITGGFHFDSFGTRSMPQISFKLTFGAFPGAFPPPAPNTAFIFSFAFIVFIASEKDPFWFHRSAWGSGSASALDHVGEIWVRALVAFEGSYLFFTWSKPSPPTHPWRWHWEDVGTNPGG